MWQLDWWVLSRALDCSCDIEIGFLICPFASGFLHLDVAPFFFPFQRGFALRRRTSISQSTLK